VCVGGVCVASVCVCVVCDVMCGICVVSVCVCVCVVFMEVCTCLWHVCMEGCVCVCVCVCVWGWRGSLGPGHLQHPSLECGDGGVAWDLVIFSIPAWSVGMEE